MDIKYTFSDFPLDVIFRSMAPFIANLEQTFHITAVCGQIAGGRAMGLSNSKSDNDFDIFYKQAEGFTPPGLKYIQEVTICDKPVVVEFNFINFHKLVNAAKTAFSQEHQDIRLLFIALRARRKAFYPKTFFHAGNAVNISSPSFTHLSWVTTTGMRHLPGSISVLTGRWRKPLMHWITTLSALMGTTRII